jgi:uncharacterized Zn-finger protein
MRGKRSNRSLDLPSFDSEQSSDPFELRIKSKRFKCSICKKRFSSKHCLREHSYKHLDVKPYNCLTCSKQFRHASQFTLHKQTHTTAVNKVVWPRLEDLERKLLIGRCLDGECGLVVTLPPISKSIISALPPFQSIFPLRL